MVPEAQRLCAVFVAAMPSYLTALCAEHGYPLDRHTVESIEDATRALDVDLTTELERDFRAQRRSPLEIVRASLVTVSGSLAERGVVPAYPVGAGPENDPYGLAPGSSIDLGQEAHEAHLQWGVAKAGAFVGDAAPKVTTPAVAVMASDRADRDALVASAEARGMTCVVIRNPGGVAAALDRGATMVAVVDLAHRSGRDAIDRFTAAGITTIAYGDAIDDLLDTGLQAQGVRHVVERRRLLADPTGFIPLVV